MLFVETVAVYCGNHTEHTDTLCGQNAEFLYAKLSCTCNERSLSGIIPTLYLTAHAQSDSDSTQNARHEFLEIKTPGVISHAPLTALKS
jgi:hypothetical protein